MEYPLSYVIFCLFFVTTAYQPIIFIYLISLKFCESFKIFLAVFAMKFQKIGYVKKKSREGLLDPTSFQTP